MPIAYAFATPTVLCIRSVYCLSTDGDILLSGAASRGTEGTAEYQADGSSVVVSCPTCYAPAMPCPVPGARMALPTRLRY
eukprot:1392094-Rhodomonas_salina.2